MMTCGSACVDLASDDSNCGACGSACGTTAECVAGVCDGPLAVLQTSQTVTSGDTSTTYGRDAFVLQTGTLDLVKLDTATFTTDRVVDHAVLPDGSGVVLVAANDTAGVIELYLVSTATQTLVKLNPALATGSSVLPGIVLSADGKTLLYRVIDHTGITALYEVKLAHPGTAAQVNGTLVTGDAGVSRVFALSADGARAVYIADEDTAGLEEAFTVDLSAATPGASVKLNLTITQSIYDLAMTSDGTQVVYRALNGNNNPQLFEVDVAAPGTMYPITNSDGAEGQCHLVRRHLRRRGRVHRLGQHAARAAVARAVGGRERRRVSGDVARSVRRRRPRLRARRHHAEPRWLGRVLPHGIRRLRSDVPRQRRRSKRAADLVAAN